MAKMGRPRKIKHKAYRVSFARPARKDSGVAWTSRPIEEIKRIYGERLLMVEEYKLVGEVELDD